MSNPSARPQGRQRPSTNGYETRDARAQWVFGVFVFLLVAGFIMHLCIAGLVERLKKTPSPQDQWTGARREAALAARSKSFPQLQIQPPVDLKQFRAHEEAELSSYGWIDRTAGVVRIPIARAMDLLLERGLPTRSGTNNSELGPSSYELQRKRPESPQPEIQEKK